MPRTGRPIKGKERKERSLQLRLTNETMEKIDHCSNTYNITRTEVVERGIDLLYEQTKEK